MVGKTVVVPIPGYTREREGRGGEGEGRTDIADTPQKRAFTVAGTIP